HALEHRERRHNASLQATASSRGTVVPSAVHQFTPTYRQEATSALAPPTHYRGRDTAPQQSFTHVRQRTLCRSVVLYGQGLQSGLKTGMILSPMPPHSGILFRNITTGHTMPASVDCIEST